MPPLLFVVIYVGLFFVAGKFYVDREEYKERLHLTKMDLEWVEKSRDFWQEQAQDRVKACSAYLEEIHRLRLMKEEDNSK